MRPDGFRNDWGFVGCSVAALSLATGPAVASPFNTSAMAGNAPLAVALGAAAFAVLAILAMRKLGRDGRAARLAANEQIAGLRAQLDEYEALLSAAREVTVLWTAGGGRPQVFGQAAALLPPGRRPEAILDFPLWLAEPGISRLAPALEALRVRGESFALTLDARQGGPLRVAGSSLGAGAVMRIRPAAERLSAAEPAAPFAQAQAVLAALDLPAFVRNGDGRQIYANPAYEALARGRKDRTAPAPDLLETPARASHLAAVLATGKPQTLPLSLVEGPFDLVEFRLGDGSAGYLRPKNLPVPASLPHPPAAPPGNGRVAALVAALALPVAIFDARQALLACNTAYAELWKLTDWLKPGLEERAILDRLRRDGLLPSEPDYQAWKAHHLESYALAKKRTEPWHLPDGRSLNVTVAPAGPEGGVIYLFEDISRELELMSQNRALLSVQRSTLNALSDAVAVFGTNGRLQLFNPRLSTLWRLPMNLLEQNPHIDQIADAAAATLPQDGATIWRSLKRAVIDLSPTRTDSSGRLTRSDGRLLDYAVVRLPDGQNLMTFLDVTESASYSRVLKERNEALVTADRLKDAFVQNVSYELRSPLTNIIGFADLLAAPETGPLNERQRSYTDYIRASSATLGILIDNILDLATVDAGIAELRPEPQDVAALVEKARAGLAATFAGVGGGSPINLKIDIARDLPPIIADGTRLVQILYNLLASAVRFSEPGAEVRLGASARGGRLLFVVEDDGVAMSEEMRAAMLDRPEGGPVPSSDRGAGLGLAIVRAFVSLHGGSIAIEERAGGGSRVVVSLPQDASAATSTAAE